MPTPPLTEEHAEELVENAKSEALPTKQSELAKVMGLNPKTIASRIASLGLSETLRGIFEDNKRVRRERLKGLFAPHTSSPQDSGENGHAEETAKDEPTAPQVVGATSDVKPDVGRIIRSTEAFFDMKMARALEKAHQSIRFPHGPVAIFFVGDQHIGNGGTDVRRMLDEQDLIMATPASYVWQMGDVVDNFVIGRLVAENWKESAPVWDQWELARYYLNRWGDKLVAVNGGNHDFWHHKVSGIDYTREVTPSGVLYDADTIRATIHVGPHEFKVWTRHKWRGSSMYNPTHGQERGAREDDPDQDIYVGAHTHTGAVTREFVRKASRKLAIQIGTYKMVDDYAIEKGFPRHDASTAVGVVLFDDGSFFAASDIRAILNHQRAVYKG